MKRTTDSKKKYLMLISVLMLMLVLCGCRSRLTNNTDVVATINDEDGYLTEEYEMRRYDLDSPVAQKPLFTGWGSGDDDSYDYTDDGSFDNYDDTYDDGWDEADDFSDTTDDDTSDTASPTPGSSTTTTRPSLPSRQSTTTTGNIIVTLDPNGGSVTPTSIRVSKNSTYSGLPVANRKGYDFQGWYTEKEDGKGSKVMSSTKVTKSTAHTLYAHWKESDNDADKVTITIHANDGHGTKYAKKVAKNTTLEKALSKVTVERPGYEFVGWFTKKTGGSEIDPKKKITKNTTVYAHWKASDKKMYTVSFDGNGGNDQVVVEPESIQVEEDGTYGNLPSAKRAGYKFAGWYTEKEGGSQVKAGDAFKVNSNQTLFAHWDDDWYNYLDGEYKKAANNYEADADCYVYNEKEPSRGKKSLIADSKGNCVKKPDEGEFNPPYVLIFGDPSDETTLAKAKAAYDEYKNSPSGTIILIVPSDTVEGNNDQKLYYRMLLLNILHGNPISDEQLDLTFQKLNVGEGVPITPYIPD